MKKSVKDLNGDFTPRERQIREALFSVFYEKDWMLTFRPPETETAMNAERWKFVDKVIDKLRNDKLREQRKR